ncbi:2998_t:CDS:2, partial [Racocetra fulgida]
MTDQNEKIPNSEGGTCPVAETLSYSTLSPEVKKRIEENRFKAMAIQLERLQNRSNRTSQTPTEQQNTESTTSTNASNREEKLRPMKKFQNYADYDFSKMENTRGGFLLEDSVDNSKKRKLRELEPEDPPINPILSENPRCKECKSVEIDYQFHRTFRINICKTCKEKFPEKYSLLTKTEAKEVEEFSFKKWGGAEALDKEFEKRQNEKKKRKDKKFKSKLA